jgi:dihydrofolate reductase
MPVADRLYITHVHRKAPADVYFPEIDKNIWIESEKEKFQASDATPAYTYVVYEKKSNLKMP